MSEILFLDTCLFFTYSYSWERDNSTTKKIFENGKRIVTSNNVIDELNRRKGKRKKFYLDLICHINSGGSLDNFMPLFSLNENDKSHIRQFKAEIRKQCNTNTDVLAFVRHFIKLIDKKTDYCKKRLETIVSNGNDLALEVILGAIINNVFDIKIIVDAVEWSEKIPDKPYFITLDRTDILKKRTDIHAHIARHRGIDPHPLEIKYLKEV